MLQRLRERLNATDVFMWVIGASLLFAIIYGSFATLAAGTYSGRQWVDLIIAGLAQGSIYALIALGYTLVYGVLRMINFAHSEVFMGGAYIGFFAADALNRSGFLQPNPVVGLLIVFLVSMATSLTIAVLLERVAYRPLRRAPRLVPLITAIGASFFLQYVFRGLFGSKFKPYPDISALSGSISITPDFNISRIELLVIISAAVLMFILYLYVQKTKAGKAMRAVAEDKDVAALMGINVDSAIVRTFMLGGAMAGAAGVLYALTFRNISYFMGFIPGIKAFTAAVLGGIGNIPGAMLGGLFLGLIESVGPSLFLQGLSIPAPYQLKDAIAFTMLVMVLIFRPTGILGEQVAVKKA